MGARSVIDHVLDAREKLRDLIREALHNVHDQDPEQLLIFLVLSFHEPLFHRPPCRSELLAYPKNSSVLFHDSVLELWSLVTAHHTWDSS